MDKLYRLVGLAGFCFNAYGVGVGVRVNDARVLKSIQRCLPFGWRFQQRSVVECLYSFIMNDRAVDPRLRRFHLLYKNQVNLARTTNEAELLDLFESDLNSQIAQSTATRFFVHAGVVAWNGRAIVIPGPSNSGKTTLVREFMKHGATYYSDEFAVLDRNGYVHPFPKPLGIRAENTQKQTKVSANELGAKTGLEPLPIGHVLVTYYRNSAKWRPKDISAGAGALTLLANALSARNKPENTLLFLERAVRGARILKSVRGTAREVVQMFCNTAIDGHGPIVVPTTP